MLRQIGMIQTEAAQRSARRRFVAALGVGQIVCWGALYYSFPLLAEPMAQEFGLSKPEIYAAATAGLAVAGVAAYPVGAAIDRGHGRAVMVGGAVLGAALLFALSLIETAWALFPLFAGIGLAQAMTMYEPAFAVVARRFGAEARAGITALTLWGGFASTVFVPLIQLLIDFGGWRGALPALAGLTLLCAALPYALTITPDNRQAATPPPAAARPAVGLGWALRRPAFWGLAAAFTSYYAVFSALTFHLYPLLLERGFNAVTVVAAIALIGPAQVAGRLIIWAFADRRPIRAIGAVTVAGLPAAVLLLWLAPPGFAPLAAFAVIYGAANGVMTIVRGLAVPEMLTNQAYGAINGALAAPSILAKAAAPLAAAYLWRADGSYDAVLAAALVGLGVAALGFWSAALCAPPDYSGT